MRDAINGALPPNCLGSLRSRILIGFTSAWGQNAKNST
jgi:hypothetical protein